MSIECFRCVTSRSGDCVLGRTPNQPVEKEPRVAFPTLLAQFNGMWTWLSMRPTPPRQRELTAAADIANKNCVADYKLRNISSSPYISRCRGLRRRLSARRMERPTDQPIQHAFGTLITARPSHIRRIRKLVLTMARGCHRGCHGRARQRQSVVVEHRQHPRTGAHCLGRQRGPGMARNCNCVLRDNQ